MPCTGTPSAFAQCTHTCWLLAVSVRFQLKLQGTCLAVCKYLELVCLDLQTQCWSVLLLLAASLHLQMQVSLFEKTQCIY